MMYYTETESDTLPTNEGITTKYYAQYKTFISPHNMQIYTYEFYIKTSFSSHLIYKTTSL